MVAHALRDYFEDDSEADERPTRSDRQDEAWSGDFSALYFPSVLAQFPEIDLAAGGARNVELVPVHDAGDAIPDDLVDLATEFNLNSEMVILASRFLSSLTPYLGHPDLALDSDGEIVFDWLGNDGRMLAFTLREDGRVSYAARISDVDKDHGTKQFVDVVPEEVLQLARRFSRR